MFKKVNFNSIIVTIFCIILLYCFLLVGSPLQNNIQIINVCFNILCIIVIIKKLKTDKEIKITKIDILIFGLIFIQFIPIIFQTQSSLSYTVDSILKYISVFNVFIIVKYILKIDKKYLNYISNTIIIASVLLVIFGIDMMHDNIFQKAYDFLNTIVVYNSSKIRMDSLYEYPNSFAVFLGVAFILSIENILRTRKEKFKPILYFLICIFQMYGIVMSGSRLSILMIIVVLVLWCIVERKKIFNKKIVIIVTSIIALCALVIILCLKLDTTLILFNETKQERSEYIKQINNVTPNTEYDFNFDISAFNDTEKNNKFKIVVRELTKTAEKICENEITFDTFEGVKNIHIVTSKNTEIIRICFSAKETIEEKTKLEVKELTMNEQKIRLNYLLIPISFMNRIENISIDESSITERFVIIKDGIKLGMQNFFTGFGNNGWRYNYKSIREYNYSATQMHSYIVEIFIQSGIIGLIVIVGLFILLGIKIVKIIKQKKVEYYPIIFTVIFGLIHSLFDFDMNFYAILILMFMLTAIIDYEVEEKYIIIKKQRFVNVLAVISTIIVLFINIGSYVAYKIDKNSEDSNITYKNWDEKYQKSNLKVKLAPYHYEYIEEKIEIITFAKISRYINLDEETYQSFTDGLIEILIKVVKNEQDRNILSMYKKLMTNCVENINENNIDSMLEIIDNCKNEVANKAEYAMDAYAVYREISDKLDEKNTVLQNEDIQKLSDELKKLMKEQEGYFLRPIRVNED